MGQLSRRVSIDRPLSFHKKIYAAIRDRNPQDARSAMQEHIVDAQALLAKTPNAD
jgi:DNA-binding FadR family transcriptional regulator